jgi:hypothetical protein
MTLAQKGRRWLQSRFHGYSGHDNQGSDVVITVASQSHDFRIDELFPGEPGLAQERPYSRMKPEHCPHNLFNNGNEPISASNMKEFVTRDTVLPGRTQREK